MGQIQRYFLSDFHFGHWNEEQQRGIITFERTQFKTIMDHDLAIDKMIEKLATKIKPGDEVWNLGDFGELYWLWTTQRLKDAGAITHFILGNHDAAANIPEFEQYFDYVHKYPVWLSQKLVISHFPVAVYPDTINIHGHLHSSKLQDINHINASIHVTGYKPITEQNIAGAFSKLPKFNRRFLYEPWAKDYQFIQEKEDVIMDKDGKIDLSASRLLQKINADARKEEKDNFYNPYTGGL